MKIVRMVAGIAAGIAVSLAAGYGIGAAGSEQPTESITCTQGFRVDPQPTGDVITCGDYR